MVGVPGQVIARSRPRSATAATDLDEALLPDLVGVTLGALQRQVDELERDVNGGVRTPEIRPSASGVWKGEDFSI